MVAWLRDISIVVNVIFSQCIQTETVSVHAHACVCVCMHLCVYACAIIIETCHDPRKFSTAFLWRIFTLEKMSKKWNVCTTGWHHTLSQNRRFKLTLPASDINIRLLWSLTVYTEGRYIVCDIDAMISQAQDYSDIIMDMTPSQITSLTIVYSTIYSGAHQRKHQSSTSLALVRGIYRWPVNSLYKGP